MAKEEKMFPKEETEPIEETKPQVEVPIITNVVKTPKAPKIIPYSIIRIITPYDCEGYVILGSVAQYAPLQAIEVEKDKVFVGKPLNKWVPIQNVELV